MEFKEKFFTVLVTIVAILILMFTFVPSMRTMMNEYVFGITRIDEETDYGNRKMVEDTARSMMANYAFAKSEYETYASYCVVATYDKDRCQRSLDSKASANKTATMYNNYIILNKYLWTGNLPASLKFELEVLK